MWTHKHADTPLKISNWTVLAPSLALAESAADASIAGESYSIPLSATSFMIHFCLCDTELGGGWIKLHILKGLTHYHFSYILLLCGKPYVGQLCSICHFS